MTEPSKPVFEFRAAPPAKQNRWGVLLRIFLVIPQALFAGLVLYAALALTFFAWFYAIFKGRNPYHEFNAKALRTYQRFTGYLYLLTSAYPRFSLEEDPDYVLASQLEPGELGRAKVIFRIILMIPVVIVAWILSYGLTILGLISWVTLLIRGTLPRPLHNAIVAIIRFNGRVAAYVLLLQDPYPRGLFGDKTPIVEWDETPLHADASEEPPFKATTDLTAESSVGDGEVTGALTPPDQSSLIHGTNAAATESASGDEAPTWRLVLTSGTKGLLVIALVLGVAAAAAYGRFAHFHFQDEVIVNNNISASSWNSQYRSDVVNLESAVAQYHSTFDARHPHWSQLLSDCEVVQNQYKTFDSVPYYPSQGADQTLISGLGSIYAGYNDCITIIAPDKVRRAMPLLKTQFQNGAADLKSFLQQT
jgi:Domain of unknown function (DUF4389)